MRLLLGVFLALTVLIAPLTGCGSESPAEQADDPTPTETSSSVPAPTNGPVDFQDVAVVSQSAVGGQVDRVAVDLSDEAALRDFVSQFEDARMETALDEVVTDADVAEGQTLVGAVVAVGCLPPKALLVEHTDAGLEITAVPDKAQREVNCLVPVTSVGVVAVDSSQV